MSDFYLDEEESGAIVWSVRNAIKILQDRSIGFNAPDADKLHKQLNSALWKLTEGQEGQKPAQSSIIHLPTH